MPATISSAASRTRQSDPTVNSYLEFTYGIAYLGLWTSNIDTGDCSGCLGPFEQDVYLGIRPVTGPVSWDLAALWYTYATKDPDKTGISWTDTDYVEFKVYASITPFKNFTLSGGVYWTPDQDVASPENISVEGNLAYTLPACWIFTPTLSGQIGFSDADNNSIYVRRARILATGTATTSTPIGTPALSSRSRSSPSTYATGTRTSIPMLRGTTIRTSGSSSRRL